MIIIVRNGVVTVIAHENDARILDSIGQSLTWQRGGHVVPASWWKRCAFHLARKLLGRWTGGRAWTRTWRGAWLADMRVSGGPLLGPFAGRQEAMAAEEFWLARRIIKT